MDADPAHVQRRPVRPSKKQTSNFNKIEINNSRGVLEGQQKNNLQQEHLPDDKQVGGWEQAWEHGHFGLVDESLWHGDGGGISEQFTAKGDTFL